MNLIDAIKSGRRFNRKDRPGYIEQNFDTFILNRKELLAEDWELEPEVKSMPKKMAWINSKNVVELWSSGLVPTGNGERLQRAPWLDEP